MDFMHFNLISDVLLFLMLVMMAIFAHQTTVILSQMNHNVYLQPTIVPTWTVVTRALVTHLLESALRLIKLLLAMTTMLALLTLVILPMAANM
jgi:hypothetical protein